MSIVCRQCESRLEEGAVVCPACGCAVEEPVQAESDTAGAQAETAPGEVSAGPRVLIEPLPDTGPAYKYELDSDLVGIGGWLILPAIGLADLVVFEAINNACLLIATVCLNVLLYRRKKAFPLFMMLYLGAQFLLGLTDHLMALHFNPHSSWTGVVRGFIAMAIWIPYFLQSRRVEVTFVN